MQLTIDKDKFLEESKKAVIRSSAKELLKLAKVPIMNAMILNLKADNKAIELLFFSEVGDALLAYILGVGIGLNPGNDKLDRLGSELRVLGTSMLTDLAVHKVLENVIKQVDFAKILNGVSN